MSELPNNVFNTALEMCDNILENYHSKAFEYKQYVSTTSLLVDFLKEHHISNSEPELSSFSNYQNVEKIGRFVKQVKKELQTPKLMRDLLKQPLSPSWQKKYKLFDFDASNQQIFLIGDNKPIINTQNISSSKINASGAAAFSLGDISGTVANTINQLPSSSNPDEPGIKELLNQLQEAIGDPDLSEHKQKQALDQVKILGEAEKNPQDQTMQEKAEMAVGFLEVIAKGLEPASKLAQACATVLPKILLFFGLSS